jgi:hypothetical protein
MTADPWALLREARQELAAAGMSKASNVAFEREWADKKVAYIHARIDAALAERQDSAKNVVEWHAYGYARNEFRSRINGADATVRFLAPNISDIDTQYSWNVSLWGGATTLAEAKSAAIAAAKGMR